jgi:predicted flavoprotein YhiN
MSKGVSGKKIIPGFQNEDVQSWIGLGDVDAEVQSGDTVLAPTLRPGSFADYVGQENICENISIACDGKSQKGEVVITRFGLEGNAIYALSPQIQKALSNSEAACIFIDLKPTLSDKEIFDRIAQSPLAKTTETLRTIIHMSSAQINILKKSINKEEFVNHESLASSIKRLPLLVTAAAPLDEAISTTGGIDLDEVNENYELVKMKNSFCIGEMLNWNAPTGGYLLQACFSMGVHLARHLNATGA